MSGSEKATLSSQPCKSDQDLSLSLWKGSIGFWEIFQGPHAGSEQGQKQKWAERKKSENVTFVQQGYHYYNIYTLQFILILYF